MIGIGSQVNLTGKMIGEMEVYLEKEYLEWRVVADHVESQEQKRAIVAGMAANRKAALRLTIAGEMFDKIRKRCEEEVRI